MMRPTVAVIFMLAFCQVESSDTPKVFGNLHESSSLPCPVPCSGHLTWTRFQKQDDVLVRCTRVSCWSRDGFSLSDEQYLRGNSSLTILTADYSLRGLYMAKCDSETVCEVVFTLSPEEMTPRVVTPGEPIDVHLPLIDLVEVTFTASDAEQPSNLQICTVDKDKIHCSPDYKERASLLNTLQITGGRVSDTGIYTVRDTVNDEMLAKLQISVRGPEAEQQHHSVRRRSVHSEEKPCPDSNQESSMPAWEIALMVVMVILLILLVMVIVYLRKENQKLRKESTDSKHQQLQMTGNTNGVNGVNGKGNPNPADVEISVPLTDQQH